MKTCIQRGRSSHSKAREGAALITALFGAVSVAMLGAWLLQTQAAVAQRQKLSIDTKTALYIAEAGLAEASFQISQGKSGSIGSESAPATYKGGIYWVESEELDGKEISLTSTARSGSGQFRVNLTIVPNQNPVSKLGIFGDEGVVIGDRVLIDGYDASEGPITGQFETGLVIPTTTDGAIVGSNGDIELRDSTAISDNFDESIDASALVSSTRFDGNSVTLSMIDDAFATRYDLARTDNWVDRTTIAGDVLAGPEGVLLTNGTARVKAFGTRAAEAVLPEVILPADVGPVSASLIANGTEIRTSDPTLHLEAITVTGNGCVKLYGPLVLQVERIQVDSHSWLMLYDQQGPITIYVTESIDMAPGSVLSSISESKLRHGTTIMVPAPADLSLDDTIRLEATGDFRGVIYAPGHRITIPQTIRLYGSAVAKHITIADGAWISHDRALEKGGVGFPSLPKRRQWRVIPLGGSTVGPGGGSLGLALHMASTPQEEGRDLTPERDLELLYLNLAGNKRTYRGALAAFDAAVAQRILSVRWKDPVTNAYGDWTQPPGSSPDDIIARWRDQMRAATDATPFGL